VRSPRSCRGSHLRRAAALVVVLTLAGCSPTDQVEPQPCEQRLVTTGFQVCLPHDAEVIQSEQHRAIATVGDYEITLEERSSQEGDPGDAAFAGLLWALVDIGTFIAPTRPQAIIVGPQGAIEVDGVDGAFQALEAGWDRGDVDDAFAWGRALTLGGRTASAVVLRIYDVDDEVSDAQLAAGRRAALPLLVTLGLRQDDAQYEAAGKT